MITEQNIVDIVVFLKTLTSCEVVEPLGKKVRDDLRNLIKNKIVQKGEQLADASYERGIEISYAFACVRVTITT
ncbi:unnamed protein product [Diabrotica balteata]|uniref:DZF domain-containing protein n=1 Tax=Diabrotica balteata TaxID=107213 RepID=A0A9N9X7B7_DIABA|nr:unnamed protein product [Diabrotica balteata]